MLIDIVIPSKGRIEKLQNCINSILKSKIDISISIHLYLGNQNEYDYFHQYFSSVEWIHLNILENYRVPTFWNGYLKSCKANVMCYLNDDVIFFEDTLKNLYERYVYHFPDFDGVLGLNQINIPSDQKVEAAFGVIGMKYADRFPDRQVFCPEYYRFYGDFELWRYASEINKFVFGKDVRIEHFHPAFYPNLEDNTHREVRRWIARDRDTFRKRQEKNFLWGRTWDLINER